MKPLHEQHIKKKLADFQEKPPHDAWEKIQKELDKNQPKIRLFPFWWKRVGVAASILLIGLFGGSYLLNHFNHENSSNPLVKESLDSQEEINSNNYNIDWSQESLNIENQDKLTNQNSLHRNKDFKDQNNLLNTSGFNQSKTRQLNTNNRNQYKKSKQDFDYDSKQLNPKSNQDSTNPFWEESNTNTKSWEDLAEQNNQENPFFNPNSLNKELQSTNPNKGILEQLDLNNEKLANSKGKEKEKSLAPEELQEIEEEITDLASLLEEEEDLSDEQKNEIKQAIVNRFDVLAYASPLYFNNFANNSTLAELQDYSNGGQISAGFGIKAGYALNKRWKIRTGIAQINLSQITQNVPIVNQAAIADFSSSEPFNQNSSNLQVGNINYSGAMQVGAPSNSLVVTRTEVQSPKVDNLGTVEQQIQYIEIPMEAEYKIVDNKIVDISATAGMSTYVLSNNQILADTDSQAMRIGEANNLNSINFSTNAGVRVDFRLNKSLHATAEPQFRYMLNTVNNSQNNNNYILGVNAGLRLEF